MTTRRPTLWAIVGATGTGKSSLSLDLAQDLRRRGIGAEIINADAMQLYRGMNIGTAKLDPAERRGIPHHLFDVLDVTEEASVARYQPEARTRIESLLHAGNDVILVGGSGLYVSSVVYEFKFPPRDSELRAALEHEAAEDGIDSLIAELTRLAPTIAETVDLNNPRRVIRALELARLGETAQVTLPKAPKLWHPSTRIIGVGVERKLLVPALDERVQGMWQSGIVAEVQKLIPEGIEHGKTASRAIGYAQTLEQIRGTLTEEEAIEETQRLTRRYARRQVSWFKRYPEIEWIDGPNLDAVTR